MTHSIYSVVVATFGIVGTSAALAQGALNYQAQTRSDDYTLHALSATLERGTWWTSLYASSGYAGSSEVDQSWSASVGGVVSERFALDARAGQSKDTSLTIDEFTLGGDWKTRVQWVAGTPLRLGLQWGFADYSLRNSALAAANRLPDQYYWGLTGSLPVTANTAISWRSQWSWYTIDPVTMAAQLLQRKRPRVNAAMGLADFAASEHRLGVDWRTERQWRWSLGGSYGQTVLGQSQRTLDASLELPWGAVTTLGLSIQHAQSDAVLRANGQVAMPHQASNSLSLNWNWSWE